MKIAIGSDHVGYELKGKVIAHLKEKGIEVKDFGCLLYTSPSPRDVGVSRMPSSA